MGRRKGFSLFGTDYEDARRHGVCAFPTCSISPMRMAGAEAAARRRRQRRLQHGGTGTGTTVRELIATIRPVHDDPLT